QQSGHNRRERLLRNFRPWILCASHRSQVPWPLAKGTLLPHHEATAASQPHSINACQSEIVTPTILGSPVLRSWKLQLAYHGQIGSNASCPTNQIRVDLEIRITPTLGK